MPQTVSLIISGKVHGVFFRQSARKKAMELGITGTVQNNPDGSVAIVATGSTAALDTFIEWSKKGPPAARVTHVAAKSAPLQSFNGFDVIR